MVVREREVSDGVPIVYLQFIHILYYYVLDASEFNPWVYCIL